ncbi:MAG: FAD-dependent thymidylate synthase [Theionarchaea archaeon]|nr:FAD-dependent thymidylate synthase [Theionarchaea archaeon]
MKVSLIAYTPDPDRLCAQAALVSKWPKGWSDFKDQWNDKTDMQHLIDAVEKGHVSVIEHASFTFSIEGISRACAQQLTRHRLASYTMLSQRYSEMNDPEAFVIPPSIIGNQTAENMYYFYMTEAFAAYNDLLQLGIKPEDARFLLPNATKTNIIVTMNARELLHFFSLRCCGRAQWEIREMANEMLRLAKEVAPIIFSKAGPQCVKLGFCPEKELTCGRMEVK